MSAVSADAEAAGVGAARQQVAHERGRDGVGIDAVLGALDASLEGGDLH
jgi:hypothetical protein